MCSAGLAVLAGAPVAALAQRARADFRASAADIVVTANRREQALSDVPMSITALGGVALEQRNITNVQDLGNLVSGLSISETGTSIPLYSLRGVGVTESTVASGSSVAIYVDEVPLIFPATTVGAALDLQRIEVLKGPQGTLYGQNSTGGAINYIANKPSLEFNAGVTASYGRFDTASVEGFVSGPISDTVRFRLAARTIQSGDWQKSFTRDASAGEKHKVAGRALLEMEPSDRVNLLFNFNGWTDKSDTIRPQLVTILPAAPATLLPRVRDAPLAPGNARAADWDSSRDFKRDDYFWQGSLRANIDLTDELSLTPITSYDRFKIDAGLEIDGIGFDPVAGDDTNVNYEHQSVRAKSFNQEVRLSAQFQGINLVVGANYNWSKVEERRDQFVRDASPSQNLLGRPYDYAIILNNQRIKSWAVFTNIEIPLTDQVTLSGGLRINTETRNFNGCTGPGNLLSAQAFNGLVNFQRASQGLPALTPAQETQSVGCWSIDANYLPALAVGRLKQSNTPWNVTLNWKPNDDFLLYGRVSKGFKSGNFPTQGASNNLTYTPVVQEELQAYEVGVRATVSPAIRFEAAAFWYDYTNKQQRGRIDTGPPFGLVGSQVNIPKARIKGLEGSVILRPVAGFTLNASGVYIDSEVRRYTGFTLDGRFIDQAGNPLNLTPKYSANVDANYDFPISDTLGAFIGANLAYRSKTVSGIAASSQFRVNAYTLLDAQIGVEAADKRWRAWIFGKNLTNKYYWTNVLKVGDVVTRYAGDPVTYGVAASMRF